MHCERNRLNSWYLRRMHDVPPEMLAASGFFEELRTAVCAFCGYCFHEVSYRKALRLITQHNRHCRRCVDNVPLGPDDTVDRGKTPTMSCLHCRVQSLARWPGRYIDVYLVAECGFFYYGDRDIVECFFCGRRVDRWFSASNPLHQHQNVPCMYFNKIMCELSDHISYAYRNVQQYNASGPFHSAVLRHVLNTYWVLASNPRLWHILQTWI